ncbi:MAG: hypothetical protein COA45_01665 [Zetaproteobacteria bacterium]|nr:MAG: hypothetical protein COA45_01665 [Zetaproteobacteria bacterium]
MIGDEYLQTVLTMMGVPSGLFDVADPMSVLFVYIFSTQILTFILSVVIWLMLFLFKSHHDVGIKKQMKVSEKHSKTHRYDMKDPFKMEAVKKPSMLGMAMRGVIIPIIVIYIALSISMSIFNA